MEFELNKAMSILERTPQVLKDLLKDLSPEWTDKNEGDNTWSPFDVVGHLVHGEKTDWITRTKIILSDSTRKEFEPFDRFAQFESSKGKTLNQLLEEFETLRVRNLEELRALNISRNDLSQEGLHPQLGKVNLKQLLATWTAHDLGHIVQISRVMAKQYKSEVGPWIKYIGILKK